MRVMVHLRRPGRAHSGQRCMPPLAERPERMADARDVTLPRFGQRPYWQAVTKMLLRGMPRLIGCHLSFVVLAVRSQRTPPLVSRHASVVRTCTDCGKTKPLPTTRRSKARATASMHRAYAAP